MSHEQMDPQARHLMTGAGIAMLIVSGIVISVGAIRRNATEMAVTNRRVVVKTGIAARTTIEMLLNKIESIEVNEPGMGRVLGYGSITLIGTGGTNEAWLRQQLENPSEHVRTWAIRLLVDQGVPARRV